MCGNAGTENLKNPLTVHLLIVHSDPTAQSTSKEGRELRCGGWTMEEALNTTKTNQPSPWTVC